MKNKVYTYYDESQLPLIMTTYEVSILLRCSEEYIRRLARNGEIKHIRNGKNLVFRKNDVLDYLGQTK